MVGIQGQHLAPVAQGPGLAPEGYTGAVARVSGLLVGQSPPTVARFVVAVVIQPIKRVVDTGAQAHISEEGAETGGVSIPDAPFRANLDAPGPVGRVAGTDRVVAAVDHAAPNLSLWKFSHYAYLSELIHSAVTHSAQEPSCGVGCDFSHVR